MYIIDLINEKDRLIWEIKKVFIGHIDYDIMCTEVKEIWRCVNKNHECEDDVDVDD